MLQYHEAVCDPQTIKHRNLSNTASQHSVLKLGLIFLKFLTISFYNFSAENPVPCD